MVYTGAFSLIAPVQWTQKFGASTMSLFSEAVLSACSPVAHHGGVAFITLAAALHIGLHAKSERVLEAVLYALTVGDALQLTALTVTEAADGWRFNRVNTYGVVFTVVCMAVRLVLLRDLWSRKRARPQMLAALAQELDVVQQVFRHSMEISAYVANKAEAVFSTTSVPTALDSDPPLDFSDIGVCKED